MDVQLPNGKILTDIPAGTTQAQIAARVPPEWLMTPEQLHAQATTPPVAPSPASPGSELNLDSSGQPIPVGMNTRVNSLLSPQDQAKVSEQSLTPTRQNAAQLMNPGAETAAANFNSKPDVGPAMPQATGLLQTPAARQEALMLAAARSGNVSPEFKEGVPGWNLEQQFGAGTVNSLTAGMSGRLNPALGAAVAAPAKTGMEEVARGAGDLVGFLTGPGLQAAKGTVGLAAGLEHIAGESFVKALAKDVAAQSATLGLATGISATGQALDANSPEEAAQILANASASGAGMGAIFGSFARILPDNTVAQIAGRVLGVNATMDALNGTNPNDQRSLEKKLFDYGLNTVFALNGAGRTTGGWLADSAATKAQQAKTVDAISSAPDIDSAINAAHQSMDEHGKSVAAQLQAIRPLTEAQNGPATLPVETENLAGSAASGRDLGAGGNDLSVRSAGMPAGGSDIDAAIRAEENARSGNERGAVPVEDTGLQNNPAIGSEANKAVPAVTPSLEDIAGLYGTGIEKRHGERATASQLEKLAEDHRALQIASTSGVLQHAQEGTAEAGSERQRVESGQQGTKATQEGNRPAGGTENKAALNQESDILKSNHPHTMMGMVDQASVREDAQQRGVEALRAMPSGMRRATKMMIERADSGKRGGLVMGTEADNTERAATELAKRHGTSVEEEAAKLDEQLQKSITPEQAMATNVKTKLPDDDTFRAAVEHTAGAKITPDGLLIDTVRFQKQEQEGALSVRTGVFYLPKGDVNVKHYRASKTGYGGSEKFADQTLLRAPLFVKGATGGKAPEAAYDAINGKGAYSKLEGDVLREAVLPGGYYNSKVTKQDKIVAVADILKRYGSDPAMAGDIVHNSTQGNTLRYAIQENIVAHSVRENGYDSVVGYSKKRTGDPFISEIFDVRETTYPSQWNESEIHPRFLMSRGTKVNGFYHPELGTIFVNADKANAKDIPAVILHEVQHAADDPALNAEVMKRLRLTPASAKEGISKSVQDEQGNELMYSALTRHIENTQQKRGTPEQWMGIIKNAAGIKPEEVQWSGVEQWLKDQKGGVTKDDLLNYLRANEVQVKDVTLGGFEKATVKVENGKFIVYQGDGRRYGSYDTFVDAMDARERADTYMVVDKQSSHQPETKYAKYVQPGGKNYRELLLTMPSSGKELPEGFEVFKSNFGTWGIKFPDGKMLDGWGSREAAIQSQRLQKNQQSFVSRHFDQPNILAHVRFDERTDADGKQVLHIAEVQSDWHQKGRREGYLEPDIHAEERKQLLDKISALQSEATAMRRRGEHDTGHDNIDKYNGIVKEIGTIDDRLREIASPSGVPNAPYKTSWNMLAMKRMIRYASEHGFDKISWDTGETQAARYDLATQLRKVTAMKVGNNFKIMGMDLGDQPHDFGTHSADKLEGLVGKDLAQKIINQKTPNEVYVGPDLKVGGEGMKAFYDKMLVNDVNKYVKKFGGVVRNTKLRNPLLDGDKDVYPSPGAHELVITPAMKKAALEGQPMFSKETGPISGDIYARVLQRMHRAGETGNPKEATSYLVEEAMKMGQTAGHSKLDEGFWGWAQKALPQSVVSVLKKWVANIRAAMYKNGIMLKTSDLKIDDFVAIAQSNMKEMARGKREASGGTEATNGSNASQTGIHQTETPEFKRWFGNSKVVNADGNPMIVYHGTSTDFDAFKRRVGDIGMHFGTSGQANDRIAYTAKFPDAHKTVQVMPVYLAIKNPLRLTDSGMWNAQNLDYQLRDKFPNDRISSSPNIWNKESGKWEKAGVYLKTTKDIREYIQSKGYDGIVYRNTGETAGGAEKQAEIDRLKKLKDESMSYDDPVHQQWADALKEYEKFRHENAEDSYIAFERNQIKSAIGNNGEFNPKNPSILASKQGNDIPKEGNEEPKKGIPSWVDSVRTKAADVVDGIVKEIQLGVTPMAAGSEKYRAIAKDYANAERLSRSQWGRFDEVLKKNYTKDELAKMWDSADEQNVLLMQGKSTAGKGLDRLTPEQRDTMNTLHNYGEALLQRAKDTGMFKGEGLPYWTPRMAVMIGDDGEYSLPPQKGAPSGSGEGRNITVTASSLKQRKYLTTEETEAAMKAKLGEGATVVKDIRAMPMAMARLERAIAGRELINNIKKLGNDIGEELVTTHQQDGFFTIDHPAFKTYRPKMVEVDGKMTPAVDQNGDMMMERNPLYMRNDLKGPLKAIMSEPSGKAYLGLMSLKGKVMSVVMYSPLIHNAVEFGRALPMLPGKMLTLQVYFEGNKAKHDPVQMREAILNGMVPIGGHGGVQDITGIMEDPTLVAGKSLTAKALGGAVGMVNERAGEAVKRGIDTAGDVWHNKLLWDRIGDLQMGLYTNIKRIEAGKLIKSGLSEEAADGVAGKIAAHMANRYAGALPNEAMSSMSRKIANLTMFSRSFTVGNLGVMKDVFTGLPTDVQAQIKRDYGELALRAGVDVSRRKAIGAFMIDIALMYAINSVTQDAFDYLKRDKSLNDIESAYADRFSSLWHKVQENPLSVLNSPLDSFESLTTPAQNEPGKENRVLYGYDKNGTAIYVRMPMGKIGEEFIGWTTSPLEMMKRKESTFLRPIIQTFENDRGFGRQVYNPDEPGVMGAVHAAGKIATNFMSQQIPSEALQSLINMAEDKGNEIDAYKVVGPLLGLTFSKGAPGGPAVGLMYKVEKDRRAKISEAMPDIKKDINTGNQEKAVQEMVDIGMTRNEIEMVLRNVLVPEAKLSSNALRKFGAHADEESKAKMGQLLQH